MSKSLLRELVVSYDLCRSKSPSLIGTKAKNLLSLPPNWIPPFFVITTEAYCRWLRDERQESLLAPLPGIISDYKSTFLAGHENKSRVSGLIIRQSVDKEMLEDRGQYSSRRCKFNDRHVNDAVIESWNNFAETSKSSRKVAIIVQSYIAPRAKGHLSNERRVSKDRRDWVYQYELPLDLASDLFPIRADAHSQSLPSDLLCENTFELETRLKEVTSSLLTLFRERTHVEWVWDGEKLWIVQVDFERRSARPKPAAQLPDFTSCKETEPLQIQLRNFKTAQESSKKWHKIDCIRVFGELGLPHPNVYVMDNPDTSKELYQARNIPEELERDLLELCKRPLVIRTDILSKELHTSFLLPRTEIIRTAQEAAKFLLDTARYFKECGVSPGEFCFIAHHFIQAKSSAWSLVRGDSETVDIDSIWGSPDGLLYYPHDSFNVIRNAESKSFHIEKKVRYKPYSIEVDVQGRWVKSECGDADWEASLTDEEILTIYKYSQLISRYAGAAQQIMFLVGVNSSHSRSGVLPWFFNSETADEGVASVQNVLNYSAPQFNHFEVKNRKDIELLRSRPGTEGDHLIIHLVPDEEMLRAKDIIMELASLIKQHGYVVRLEGSRLSHIYYILKRAGVAVW
jgi:hypothetical protein